MLTVACVLKSGGIYGPEHVERLRVMVRDHLSAPHCFYGISDFPPLDRCWWSRLRDNLPGWWSKVELFRPGLFTGRVLYLDLDVTVVGSLDAIVNFHAPFAAIGDYERPCLNSSVMVWDAGVADHIYTGFREELTFRRGGDQVWISECMPDAQRLPRAWCPSWKHDVKRWNALNHEAKVVIFHGRPKPWELPPDHLEIRRAG